MGNLITQISIKKIIKYPTESKRNRVNGAINEVKLQRFLDDKTAKNLERHISICNQKSTKNTIEAGPVVSSVNYDITKISQYVDRLQPHVE